MLLLAEVYLRHFCGPDLQFSKCKSYFPDA